MFVKQFKKIRIKKQKGGKKMEKSKQKSTIVSRSIKKESNWEEYLDYTKFYEPAEINNEYLEQFEKDFNIKKK